MRVRKYAKTALRSSSVILRYKLHGIRGLSLRALVGDRFSGTVMVFVPGRVATKYQFTGSLAVQIFKDLQPALKQLDH